MGTQIVIILHMERGEGGKQNYWSEIKKTAKKRRDSNKSQPPIPTQ